MEVLVLDGKKYIKASKAAKELGYTADYVGQLCRGGKVGAHLVGRSWYVAQDELSTHRKEKKRMSRVKAREQAKKSIEEHRVKINSSRKSYKNVAISYEEDNSDLIPKTRKVEVKTQVASQRKSKRASSAKKAPEGNIIENKGEKIIMSGDVEVVDVTYGVPDPNTTILRAVILNSEEMALERQKENKNQKIKSSQSKVEKYKVTTTDGVKTPQKGSFISKLENAAVIPKGERLIESTQNPTVTVEESHDLLAQEADVLTHSRSSSAWPIILALIVLAVGMSFTISASKIVIYTSGSVVPISEDIIYNISATIDLIQERF